MTCEPFASRFELPPQPATLVLVDMRRSHLAGVEGLRGSSKATVLANCRLALAAARQRGWNVAFVRGDGSQDGYGLAGEWIKGFEPGRQDAIFDRRNLSCYSSPYFAEAIDTNGGAAVLAGFFGDGACLATSVDAIRARQGLIFLNDATEDNVAKGFLAGNAVQLLQHFTRLDIATQASAAWVRDLAQGPNEAPAPRLPH